MKRRQFLRGAGVAAAATAVASPAIAQSNPELRWRLTSSYPKSLDTLYGAAEIFAKAVAEATDNKFHIQVFAAARSCRRWPRPTRFRTAPSRCATRPPITTSARTLLLPSGPRCVRPQCAHAKRWIVSRRRHEADERLLQKVQFHRLSGRQTGCQMGGWYRKEIKAVADLKGMRMRIGGFAGTVLAEGGGGARSNSGCEIYSALEKGTIDAAEWVWALR